MTAIDQDGKGKMSENGWPGGAGDPPLRVSL